MIKFFCLVCFVLFCCSVFGMVLPIAFPAFPSEVKQVVWGDRIVGTWFDQNIGRALIYRNANGQTYIGDTSKPIKQLRYELEFNKSKLWF